MQTHDQLLADAMNNYAMAHHHLSKLKETLDQMTATRSVGLPSVASVRCVREWQDWLAAHGPAVKSDIHEGTGVKFTERGSRYTFDWSPSLADASESQFTPNTLMKISLNPVGRGAPPKVYFLWSQRWLVFPKFGVGPIKPEPDGALGLDAQIDRIHGDGAAAALDAAIESGEIPTSPESESAVDPNAPVRYATIEEGLDAWADALDRLADSKATLSAATKQQILNTLPESATVEDIDLFYELALSRAKEARTLGEPAPLLGVIHPPISSHPIDPAYGVEQTLHWNDPGPPVDG